MDFLADINYQIHFGMSAVTTKIESQTHKGFKAQGQWFPKRGFNMIGIHLYSKPWFDAKASPEQRAIFARGQAESLIEDVEEFIVSCEWFDGETEIAEASILSYCSRQPTVQSVVDNVVTMKDGSSFTVNGMRIN